MSKQSLTGNTHIGRFAPSPTGKLHLGSLISALASYCSVKSKGGKWLVRIEDLDPPREEQGAKQAILQSLQQHGFEWDGHCLFQSDRLAVYQDKLQQMLADKVIYACDCSRKTIHAAGGIYQNSCRNRQDQASQPFAYRFANLTGYQSFHDQHYGLCEFDPVQSQEDFIVRRKDGLTAYQLAVVIDDIEQGITEVVRGADLLDCTPKQLALYDYFGSPVPSFLHHPLIAHDDGSKFSKQTHAKPLNKNEASLNLWQALSFLGQQPEESLLQNSPAEMLHWAVNHWQAEKISMVKSQPVSTLSFEKQVSCQHPAANSTSQDK